MLRAGSHSFFLSRTDLKVIDRYTEEFGRLIARILEIVFMSMLWPRNEVNAREAIGLRIAKRHLLAFEDAADVAVASPSPTGLRKLIAALWEEGCVFNEDNLRHMRLIIPHLDRALRLQTLLASAELSAKVTFGTLDYLAIGVVFVDGGGRPLWLNRRARETVSGSDPLRLWHSSCAAPGGAGSRSLREILVEAISSGKQGLLAVRRPDSPSPLVLTVVPLELSGPLPGGDRAVQGLVFIADPDRTDDPDIGTLRQAFDLTYREAKVALVVAQGHGLQAAADASGVAVTTARSQLQQVFGKTGTSRQAELTALLHRTLGTVRRD